MEQPILIIFPGKALAKTTTQMPSTGGIATFSIENLACVTLNRFRKSVKQLLHL